MIAVRCCVYCEEGWWICISWSLCPVAEVEAASTKSTLLVRLRTFLQGFGDSMTFLTVLHRGVEMHERQCVTRGVEGPHRRIKMLVIEGGDSLVANLA